MPLPGLKVDGKIGCNLVKQKPSAKAEIEYKMDFARVNANVDLIKVACGFVGTNVTDVPRFKSLRLRSTLPLLLSAPKSTALVQTSRLART